MFSMFSSVLNSCGLFDSCGCGPTGNSKRGLSDHNEYELRLETLPTKAAAVATPAAAKQLHVTDTLLTGLRVTTNGEQYQTLKGQKSEAL